jgi:hypothetical protein
MDIFSDFANAIGAIAIDFNFGTWALTLFAVWMGIGTAVFLKRNGIVLPVVKKPDQVKMGTVGDFAMGFFISFGFSTAGIAPFFAWSLSTMLASVADWVRKKHEGRASAIATLKAELLELMELRESDPEKFKLAIREKMGIVDGEVEPDLLVTGEEILEPDLVQVEPVLESEVEPEAEVIPEPEQAPEPETPPEASLPEE